MDLTPLALRAITQQLSFAFDVGLGEADTWWQELATQEASNTSETHYPIIGQMAGFREWIGERAYKNLTAYDYVIKNRKFEDSFSVLRDHIEDDTIGVYRTRAQQMGQSAKVWPQELIVEALERGEAETTYDNQYFFDEDHPVDPATPGYGVQGNLLTGMPLTPANLAAARARMRGFRGQNNRTLRVNPTVLGVPAALETTALQIVNGENIAQIVDLGGGNRTAIPMGNVLRGSVKVLVMQELTSETDWYLFDTSKAVKPLIFQQRIAPQFTALDQDTDQKAFERDEFLYGGRARGNAGYGLWQLALKVKAALSARGDYQLCRKSM